MIQIVLYINIVDKITFCVHGAIVHKSIVKQTQYFYTDGQRASRTQFPLQNSFALTVHKTQGLTLQSSSVCLDSHSQTYITLSRCKSWSDVHIIIVIFS